MRRTAGVAGGVLAGFVAGAILTLSLQSAARVPGPPGSRLSDAPSIPAATERQAPGTFLVWTPGGLPAGFRASLASVALVERDVVVESDLAWLTRS
ncbi:MAG: hypothetical protein ACXVQU_01445, partial [Actinomycetota bacterium]